MASPLTITVIIISSVFGSREVESRTMILEKVDKLDLPPSQSLREKMTPLGVCLDLSTQHCAGVNGYRPSICPGNTQS